MRLDSECQSTREQAYMYAFPAVRDISVVYLLELLIHLSLRAGVPGKLAAGAAFKSYLEAPLMGPRAAAADIT